MKEIPLTQGKIAIVDDEDFDLVMAKKWHYSLSSANYGRARSNNVSMHRFIMQAQKGLEVDHINGDPLDNRRSNLRIVTHAQNQKNMKVHTTNVSGAKGVSWHKKASKWQAHIMVDGKRYYLGVFKNIHEAAEAYKQAAKLHFKEFERK